MLKFDRSGWVQSLFNRSLRSRGLSSRRRRATATTEALEDRTLLANIAIVEAFLVDGNDARIAAPFAGEQLGVQVDYETNDLAEDANYRIAYIVDGVELSVEDITNGAAPPPPDPPNPQPEAFSTIRTGWYAQYGTFTVTVVLDADNTVAEDNENDNTFTFQFTPVTASPPVTMGWPLEGQPQVDFYITDYVDVDPTSDDNTRDDEDDYRGGFHTTDQLDGWYVGPPTFQDQDRGIAVLATADGVVIEADDGVFDRETMVDDPLPDPLPDTNRIVIDHGGGYTTVYEDLRRDSVWLAPGDPVVAGQLVGLVGSSGPFSTYPHVKWGIRRHGRPIAPMFDPATYLNDADGPDYSGDLSFMRDSRFSQCIDTHPFNPCPLPINDEDFVPYNFVPHLLEGMSDVSTFPAKDFQPVTVTGTWATVRVNDTVGTRWLRPDGTLYTTTQSVVGFNDDTGIFHWRVDLPEVIQVGTWTVEFLQNGAKVGEDTFVIEENEFPDIRVEFAKDGPNPPDLRFPEAIVLDDRYTPIDLSAPGGGFFGPDNGETFTIHNQGTDTLIIDAVDLPAEFDFFFPNNPFFPAIPTVIEPNFHDFIVVQPNTGVTGYYQGVVRLSTNDFQQENGEFAFSVEYTNPQVPDPDRQIYLGIGLREIFENEVPGEPPNIATRTVANVRRGGPLDEELVVDLVAELSDVTFPGNVKFEIGQDYLSFHIETINDDLIEAPEILRVGAIPRSIDYDPAFAYLKITDDDVAGFTVTETGGSTIVAENGTTDTFDIVLDAEPITDVVLNLTSLDLGEVTVMPATLTFDPLNWDVAQTVTVTGVDDATTDGDIISGINISVDDFLSDNDFDPLPDQIVAVTTIDNDIPGFEVVESDGSTIVNESGTTDNISLVLTKQPLTPVVIDVLSSDLGEAVAATPFTFTFADWNIPQQVSVLGRDDVFVDGPINSIVTFTVNDAASDDEWDPVGDQTVNVTTLDDEVPGIVVAETSGTTVVRENGATDTIDVTLNDRPLSDVVLQVLHDDATEATVSPATLTFTPGNWDVPQPVTVTGVDDVIVDGNVMSTVTIRVVPADSNDFFDLVADQTVTVTTLDDDSADVTVTPTDGTTFVNETGATDLFDVTLNAQPGSNVVIDVVTQDATEAIANPTRLTFTPANWDTPQPVTVIGQDDVLVDGAITSSFTISVDDAASDDLYDPVTDKTLEFTNLDDELADVNVVESSGSTNVAEAGGTDTLTVTLTGSPLSDVVLEVLFSDATEATAAPGTLTFTSANWNTAQVVTVTGVDDILTDGNQTSTVTIRVVDALSHDAFDGVADKDITVTTIDDDAAGITITETDGSTIVPELAGTDSFEVVLNAQPLSDVVLTVTADDATEATAGPAELTFTPLDWNTPQIVTVDSVDDDAADGDIASTVTLAVDDALSDDLFDALPDVPVNVTTLDDEVVAVLLDESDGKTLVREGSTTDTIDVTLGARPLSNVVINLTVVDGTEIMVVGGPLTFTPANFNVPQTIDISAVDDVVRDGKRVTDVHFDIDQPLSDDMWDGLPRQTIGVVSIDNDAPVILDDTDLLIDGTPLNDDIDLAEAAGTLDVVLNGELFQFTVGDYQRIVITAMGGDDDIRSETVTTPTLTRAGGGDDVVHAGLGGDTVRGGGGEDMIIGGPGPDSLNGGSGKDRLEGRAGNDSLQAANGRDSLFGEGGDDVLQGQNGDDHAEGGDDNDIVGGNDGRDTLFGGPGDDSVRGGTGADQLDGGTGRDEMTGGSGNDLIIGGADPDLIIGGADRDEIRGGTGRDLLIGGTGRDNIKGEEDGDIQVAGTVSPSIAQLHTILDEWNSGRTYDERVANIHDSPGQTPTRLNTAFLVGPLRPPQPQTAFDDSIRDDLEGGAGNDFFFANILSGDNLLDNAIDEWVDLI